MLTPFPRPGPAVRVGITGTRSLADAQIPRLTAGLDSVLGRVARRLDQAAGPEVRPHLRFLSPLARGADRLAARVALAHGFALAVPMPFPRADYERDFGMPGDRAEFRALLAHATAGVLELDGARGPEATASYEAVGRHVVDQSDLLIAVWDGTPAAGRGGTAEIVHYAAERGIPVWWLNARQDCPPVWIADLADLNAPALIPASKALDAHLDALLQPPDCGLPCLGGGLRRPAWPGRSGQAADPDLGARDDGPSCRRRAVRLARACAARARTDSLRAARLCALALLLGGAAVAAPRLPGLLPGSGSDRGILLLLALEVLALAAALALHFRQEAQQRAATGYRALAAAVLGQQMLTPLGLVLPVAPATGARGLAAWLGWSFAACRRAAPLPAGSMAAVLPPCRVQLRDWTAGALRAQKLRQQVAAGVGRRLAVRSGWLSLLVLAGLGLSRLLPAPVDATLTDGWPMSALAVLLPAFGLAGAGLRALIRTRRLIADSRRLSDGLIQAGQRLDRLDLSRPLASRALGAEASVLAVLLLRDAAGWSRVFRLPPVRHEHLELQARDHRY